MAVDWTKPIEAVHEDGRVVRLTLDGPPDDSGCYYTNESLSDMPCVWYSNGRPWVGDTGRLRGWRVRNVKAAKPAISDELVDKLCDIVRRIASDEPGGRDRFRHEARAIVAELPQPEDPDLLEARRYLVSVGTCSQADADTGKFDDHEVIGGFLAGLARGRQLEREAK